MRRLILYISSVAVLSAIAISALSGNRIKAHQSYPLQVLNRTQSFEVIKAERGQNDYSFTFKNTSDKTITSVSISPSKPYTVRSDYLFNEVLDHPGIAPGALYSDTQYLHSAEYTDTLEIKSIIFDDGSSEGDPAEIRDIEDSRLGMLVQMRRTVKELEKFLASGSADGFEFKSKLEKALDSPDDDTIKILKELKPSRRFTNQSFTWGLRAGLNNGRQGAINRIGDVQSLGLIEGFRFWKERHERVLQRCPK